MRIPRVKVGEGPRRTAIVGYVQLGLPVFLIGRGDRIADQPCWAVRGYAIVLSNSG
jgi:hypothetical protein